MEVIKMNSNNSGLDESKSYVAKDGAFTLAANGVIADICISKKDYKGITIAAEALAQDIKLVTGTPAQVKYDISHNHIVLAGTIGQNEWIDTLIEEGKLEVSGVKGTWETYVMETVHKPFAGVDKALVIAGSDKRGTIYGIYKVSEMIGVSAWAWWADSVPVRRTELIISDGKIVTKQPSVQYRGIFVNDENPCFGNWCNEKFGGVNSKMYVYVFELILRLKGNYMWPAMWGKSINIDDPESPKLADDYGIVMGTSHHEPMMRAQKEWTVLGNQYGGHANWNYQKNKEGLYRFWEDRIAENKNYEKIVTVGMRGDGDEAMIEGGKTEEIIALYEQIVTDQREILAKHINPDITQIPQVWCLYKEVEEFYSAGMKVPEDITLMLCDDNFGNVRHLPVGEMKNRKGGFGMYYHFDYVGEPRSYKWINNMPLQKCWEQMSMAYDYGVRKIWIVNVGDLKPMEFPMEYFLDLAYDFDKWGQRNKVEEYTYLWAQKEFGEAFAKDIAKVLSSYTKINGIRKPENLYYNIFHPINYGEADRILNMYKETASLAENIYDRIPIEKKEAFYQLVLYPAKASYNVYQLHLAVGKNHLFAKQGRNSANIFAQRANECFAKDWIYSEHYNKEMSGGRWKHMMTQAHIGDTGNWRAMEVNVMPKVDLVVPVSGPKLLVAVPNNDKIYEKGSTNLPDFTNIGNEYYIIDVGNGGDTPLSYSAIANQAWITMKMLHENVDDVVYVTGTLKGIASADSHISVCIDWSKIASNILDIQGSITITGAGKTVEVNVKAVRFNHKGLPRMTYVDTHGLIVMEAEHYVKTVSLGGGEWKKLDDYGRYLSSLKVFPTTLGAKTPGVDAPYMEYKFVTKATGKVIVYAFGAPTNSLSSETGMKYAISIDDEKPQEVDTFPKDTPVGHGKLWSDGVMYSGRLSRTKHKLSKDEEIHTLRFYMVDSGYVLQRLVIDTGAGLLESFLGPKETYYVK